MCFKFLLGFTSTAVVGADVIAGQLPKGKVVGKRWKILKKLGTGSFGAVYKVEDINTCEFAALKAEAIQSKGNVLKLEAHILRRLANCPMFVNILQSGKKEFYSYVVMTLLGPSLDTLIGLEHLRNYSGLQTAVDNGQIRAPRSRAETITQQQTTRASMHSPQSLCPRTPRTVLPLLYGRLEFTVFLESTLLLTLRI
ncbi:hypothetical protein Y032_0018g3498 [Ancylostoma ceylanicum]|nr:hypothetical protein Y032_0018g3498 [Ancylostoma ceylanicum]